MKKLKVETPSIDFSKWDLTPDMIDEGDEWLYSDDEDEDAVPYGCSACGGPYPHCKDACPMFDD